MLYEANLHIKKYFLPGVKKIFLSHSHKDKDLAQGMINYLATLGIDLYVDWNDSNMPRITNRETANNIKSHISGSDFFLVLATDDAMISRWVPWEIGVADQLKKPDHMAIIPVVVSGDSEFKGNEYLKLYPRMKLEGIGKIKIYEVGYEYQNSDLKDWLK
jgi:hypothetical protein